MIDFVIIGYPKCGTTWLQEAIELNFNVDMPKTKDSSLFLDSDVLFEFEKRDPAETISWLNHVDSQKRARGFSSVNIVWNPNAYQKIIKKYPKCKFILMHDNPERVIPSYIRWYAVKNAGLVAIDKVFEKAQKIFSFKENYLNLVKVVDPNQILVIDIDSIRNDDVAVLKRVGNFICAKRRYEKMRIPNPNNVKSKPRFPFIVKVFLVSRWLDKNLPALVRFLKGCGIYHWLQRAYTRLEVPTGPEDDEFFGLNKVDVSEFVISYIEFLKMINMDSK